MREPLPPIDWLVEPLIATGDRVLAYGEWGAMKSWVSLHLALSIAAGNGKWLGQFSIPIPRRVLFIDEEMSERTLRRRVKRLALAMDLDMTQVGESFQMLSRPGIRFDANGARNLLTALKQAKCDPEVIFYETLRRGLVGNEKEAQDIAAFWRNVELLLKAGQTLYITHHMRKANQNGIDDERYRASGSTDIMAGTDAAFALVRRTRDLTVTITPMKCREAEEHQPFMVGLEEDGNDGSISLYFDGLKEDYEQRRSALDAFIIDFLSKRPDRQATRGAILQAAAAANYRERTVDRALANLKGRKSVVSLAKGIWALPPASGEISAELLPKASSAAIPTGKGFLGADIPLVART